jgi:hypothetical protein
MATSTSEEDLLILEDLDLGDETELRGVVAEIEGMISFPGRGLRVSILTAEQWQTVLRKLLPGPKQRSIGRHIHTIRDPKDPQHLLVSPSAVQGINSNDRYMYQDLVFAVLRAIPCDLSGPLRRGLDDILAEAASKRIGTSLYCRNYPRERSMVQSILMVLTSVFSYTQLDWALEMRRSPERVFRALSKTPFLAHWQASIKEISPQNAQAANLIALLLDPKLEMSDPMLALTEECLTNYLKEKNV